MEQGLIATGQSLAKQVELSIADLLADHLRGIAEKSVRLAAEQHQRQLAGLASETTAKQGVWNALATQTIGSNGYVFILSSQGVVELHPDSDLDGKNIRHVDQYQKILPLIDKILSAKQGYLEYDWQTVQGNTTRPKAMYLEYFQPWDWFIAISCYRDEFLDIVEPTAVVAKIEAFRYARSGHAVLLDNKDRLITRPFSNDADNARLADLLQGLASQGGASPNRIVPYRWKDSGETVERERQFWSQPIPNLGITVGFLADRTNVAASLSSSKTTIALILCAGALLVLGAVLVTSRLIATPLHRLASNLPAPGQESRPYAGDCEVAFLQERFDQTLAALRKTTEKVASEAIARKSTENFLKIYKQIFNSTTEGLIITDANGKILDANGAFTTITGYAIHEVLGNNPRILKSDRHDAEFFQNMWRQLIENGCWEGEIWNKKKDGTVYPEWLTINSIRNDQQEIIYYFASFYEIGELKRKDKQIAFMAYHDMLTMLPNRTFLEQKLARAITRIREEGGKLSLFFIDLDNFKNVNDVFGHKFGDDLLVQVTKRFASALGDNDSLYRLSSDEFVLLMDAVENESVVYLMANRILAVLKKPFLLDFKKIYVNASVGISIFPGDGENGLEMIRSADMAMHRAKREGKNRFLLFTKGMHAELYERFRIENSIRYGLVNKEFVVFYQPKVNIANRTTTSLEALIRWNKGGKLISPGVFIPIAEESSLIDQICAYVLEETCVFHRLMAETGSAVPISVNISPRQFHNADFVDSVEDLLLRYGVDPKFVEFEVTETTAMSDVEHTLRIMHRLREMGIHFSIDDFGTGYSSLGYLSRMPVSTLKIDKQFVQNMEQNSGLVATIIAIGQQMHLNVVAEGVETEEQLLALTAMGCNEIQGYYFSRPIDANQTLLYLKAERSVQTS